ncbi:4-(cytidine 5'-diphospho)-2-C-methyl-D-erythritol kinase [Paeniglutamicibacter cryotolerans]|uniref:4-diphosphocytidyl-2-C-methyl-D-erythritol kinase n=1 Tax=Paeniglutamicibacter cryotolerans TaxID=670079 RepID=A0A839QJE7_9MICC|nr:4-(cytidine 5'-diphospho)-2-C-methyl-D-erythritol kinase [Paeniglutamicibacter cryotolerans]MBB2995970.1 4-diphosphocytidyl-2-C-methyl-D-erythritol kinase [Paeniglutamicibacter cryotolerans]
MRTVTARAPGKINVYFRVGPPREDGYHSVASLYLAVSLYEDIAATAREDHEIHVSLDPASTAVNDPESFPLGEENLVVRAARLLAEHTGHHAGVDLRITKRVPIAGGMGGGSADAAATLVACNALWGTGLNREELARLGARLGADVPFALHGGAAVGLGVGDDLAPLLLRRRTDWVLVPASYGLSTPRVYGMLDRLRAGEDVPTPTEVDPAMIGALLEGDLQALPMRIANDMTRAALALAPELGVVRDMGEAAGALCALVSGSGPTIALLASDPVHAREIITQLGDEIGVTALPVHGPVPGAGIL